jgi:hypothetical protein
MNGASFLRTADRGPRTAGDGATDRAVPPRDEHAVDAAPPRLHSNQLRG